MRSSRSARWALIGCATVAVRAVAGLRIDQTKHIFAFGDSYTAVGYEPQNGLLPLDQPSKTSSGGLNWINYLAEEHNLQNTTYDFAFCSATTDQTLVPTHGAHDVLYQVDSFLEYFSPAPAEVPWEASTSLFAMFIGINDIGHCLDYGIYFPSVLAQIRAAHDAQIERLYKAGARNFLLMAVPPMDRSPDMKKLSPTGRKVFASDIALWNAHLEDYAAQLRLSYPGASALYFDTHATVSAILDSPSTYGFKDSTNWCKSYGALYPDSVPDAYFKECEFPLKEYVFFDWYHLSWSAQAILGKAVGNALSEVSDWSVSNKVKRDVVPGAKEWKEERRRAVKRHETRAPRRRPFGRKDGKWRAVLGDK